MSVRSGEDCQRQWARELAREAGTDVSAVANFHVLYRRTGDFYMALERFPGAYCDPGGFICFRNKELYYDFCDHYCDLGVGKVDGKVRVATKRKIPISHLPSYVRV